jgi:hypothetical protein
MYFPYAVTASLMSFLYSSLKRYDQHAVLANSWLDKPSVCATPVPGDCPQLRRMLLVMLSWLNSLVFRLKRPMRSLTRSSFDFLQGDISQPPRQGGFFEAVIDWFRSKIVARLRHGVTTMLSLILCTAGSSVYLSCLRI